MWAEFRARGRCHFWVYRADEREQVVNFTVVGEPRDIDYVPVSPCSTFLEMLSHYVIWTNGMSNRNRQGVAAAGQMVPLQSPFSCRLTL